MLTPSCRTIVWGPAPATLLAGLKKAGCEVAVAADETAAMELKATFRPEVILLLGPAAGDCGRLRRTPPHLDAVYCALLEREALPHLEQPQFDDFLVLPLAVPELVARLRLWRWRRQQVTGAGLLRAGSVVVDLRNMRVTVDGAPLTLTYKEFELLCLLLRRSGQVLTREFILDSVWGPDYYGGDRTVDVHIRRLRMKIPEVGEKIATVHGTGYRFDK
jgi:DNA-binding winged helix-turn-helix (wHTH) protein